MIRQAISPRFAIRIRLNIVGLLATYWQDPASRGRNLARGDGRNNSVVQQNQAEATADMAKIPLLGSAPAELACQSVPNQHNRRQSSVAQP
jgi:hypothetical protein